MTKSARTVCDPNCHANPKCGLAATIDKGRIIAVAPADYPIPGYENRICLMGRSRLEYQYHPDRLRTPLRRVGARGEGRWEPISWEDAVEWFVSEQRRISERYGSRAVLFHQISGAYGLLTRGSPLRYAALTGASAVRASGIDFGVAKGLEAMFGVHAATFFKAGGHSLSDARNSELTIIWGGNPAVTRSVDHVELKAARRSGTRLVCIDPVRSETAGFCDEWISPRPGSDGALALAMAHEIISHGLYDREFLGKHTNMPFLVDLGSGRILKAQDLDESAADEPLVWCTQAGGLRPLSDAKDPQLDARASVRCVDGRTLQVATVFKQFEGIAASYPSAVAESLTGVAAEVIRSLALRYAQARRAALRIGYGVDRWYSADLTARAIATLPCLCGQIGVSGGGVSLVSGGQSVPVKGSRFYAPERKFPNFLSMMEADAAVTTGTPYPVKMECISLGNPYNQVKPNRNRVLNEYIRNLEFIAVIDHFITDTAKQADLVLPACTIFERTDIVVDDFIQLQQPVVPPEGEAKTDFEIFKAIAEAYGVGSYFEKSPEQYIDDMLATDSPLLEGVNYDRLARERVIYPWPSREPYVGFRDRMFKTPHDRIAVYTEALTAHGAELPYYREPIEASPDNPLFERFPLVLLSSHSRYRIHSTFANLSLVQTREPEPVVRVHPADARRRGIEAGSVVELYNDRGRVKIKCVLDEALREGCVLVREGHWIDQFIEGDPYGLTHDHHSPTAENYAHYDVLVEMRSAG
ncbi:MAG: molybdopterin-dependent oxidoreductase [Pseudomonadota bacterium]